MEELERILEYRFRDTGLLENALTHSSYANENRDGGSVSNERLEFLGDSVLGMVTADHLYRSYPDLPEGELTRTRAALVCEGSLYRVAKQWGLGNYLRLGRGEESGGGRERVSILADAVEAVLAALYLDGGVGTARRVIHAFILSPEAELGAAAVNRDYKTALQELVQRKSGQSLTYRPAGESGPDHAKTFVVEVLLNGMPLGRGEGRSKKEAEQMAARTAVARMEEEVR